MPRTYPGDDFLNPLLVRLHLEEGLDLADGQVLPVAQGDQLIERAEQLVGIAEDLALVQTLACAGNDLGEEVEGVDVLQDVGLAVGNEHHVELIQGLVDEADVVLLHGGVLGARVGQLGEGSQESLNSRPGHLAELSREDSLAPAGADGRGENNLKRRRVSRGSLFPRQHRRAGMVLTIVVQYR